MREATMYGDPRTTSLLPSMHYPAVMVAAFSLFAGLQAAGLSLIVST
jgi:hypothetical protein